MSTRVSSLRQLAGEYNSNLNRVLVSAYKVIGFGLLTLILLGIVSYVGTHLFYLVYRSWVVPTVISPNDPLVLDLRARLAHEDWMRHKLLSERGTIEVQLRKARREAELERTFELDFRRAMQKEAGQRKRALAQLSRLRERRKKLDLELRAAVNRVLEPARKKLERDYKNKLIDQDQMLRERYLLLQMAQSELASSQTELELDERERRLALEIDAFEGAARPLAKREEPITYHELTLHREGEVSQNQALGARDDVEALERSLAELDQALVRYDEILNALEDAPMLRATQAGLALAFVPYDNQERVVQGAPVYACRLGVLFCRRVGRVETYWEGEVKQPHPIYGREQRGQLAELVLDDPKFAKYDVLHVNRAPFFL
jgi:hypothetical protein